MNKDRNSETLDDRYPARRLLDLIGDKWTPIVLYCLSGGMRRFNEMHRQIPDISKKVLVQVLRSLENDGLVERTVYPVVPPKTEYRLTDDGCRLNEPVAALCSWAINNDAFLKEIFTRRAGPRQSRTLERPALPRLVLIEVAPRERRSL